MSMTLLMLFSSSYGCERWEDSITIKVNALFKQQANIRTKSYLKKISSSESYVKDYNSYQSSTSASVSSSADIAGIGGGSISAAAAHELAKISDEIRNTKNYEHEESEDTREFNNNFLQIYRDVTTEIVINGKTAKQIESHYVNSIPVSKSLTSSELRTRGIQYLKDHFPGEEKKIHGTNYISRTCHHNELKWCQMEGQFLDGEENFFKKFQCLSKVKLANVLESLPIQRDA